MKLSKQKIRQGLLVYYLIGFINVIYAQPNTFLKTYNAGNNGYAVREVNGVSYVAAGGTDFYYNFQWFTMSPIVSTNIQLIKTSTDGTLVWEKIFNYPGFRTLATWMEHTQDNGYIITGRANHELAWPPDSNDIVLLKTDANGDIQWSKIFDTGKDELGYCVQQTTDGGYIVSAFHDAVPTSLTGNTYAMLIKTDLNGNILWENKYQFAVRDLDTGESFPWVVRQTADGGYILLGTTANTQAADVYVIRVDSSGNVLWAKSYDHDNSMLRFSVGLDIIECLSGDFVIAGSMDKDQSLNQYNYPYILKISDTGALVDERFYDSAPSQLFQSGFSSVEQTPDGGFFFTGMGGYGGFGMQAQLLKTNSNFDMEWSRSYTNDGVATMGSRSGRTTSDGCYIFTGKKIAAGTVLLKTDNLGLVPCKIPGSLLELFPSVIAQNLFPLTSASGITSNDIVLTTQNGLADTSTICPVTSAILPVELLFFSAECASNYHVQLNWETASEINNDYFIVEKSFDGINFKQIEIVKGAGNSTINLKYSLLDNFSENTSQLYYRLKQVDYDGTSTISKIVSVRFRKEEPFQLISTLADYSSHTVKIYVKSKSGQQINCTLIDMLGKEQLNTTLISEGGLQLITLDATTLSKGIYLLLIGDELHHLSLKIYY